MQLAVIPLIVWALIAAFGGGMAVGGGAVVFWKDRDKQALKPDAADENGLVQNAGDPMRCVDLYYNAVLDGNHKQYQFCTLEPMAMDRFPKMVNEHKEKMLKSGLDRVAQPVRGRTEIKKVKGSRGAVVFAISPWTNKEEKFEVVEVGQGWRIVKEVFK